MNFQIFLGFIVVCYLCYYFGTVAYDLLTGRKRTASEDDKVQEEAIDISDEVREFTPVLITRKKERTASWATCLPNGRSLIPKERAFLYNNISTFIFNISDVAL